MCIQPLVSHIARREQDYTTHKSDESDCVMIARLAIELHCYWATGPVCLLAGDLPQAITHFEDGLAVRPAVRGRLRALLLLGLAEAAGLAGDEGRAVVCIAHRAENAARQWVQMVAIQTRSRHRSQAYQAKPCLLVTAWAAAS